MRIYNYDPKLRNIAHALFLVFSLLSKELTFIFYLLLLQLVLCRVVALKSHSADYILLFVP